jgi:hypothetical protein
MMTTTATFDATREDDDQVKIRLDRPGVAAVSYTGDPIDLIRRIAEAAGYAVVDDGENAVRVSWPQ